MVVSQTGLPRHNAICKVGQAGYPIEMGSQLQHQHHRLGKQNESCYFALLAPAGIFHHGDYHFARNISYRLRGDLLLDDGLWGTGDKEDVATIRGLANTLRCLGGGGKRQVIHSGERSKRAMSDG